MAALEGGNTKYTSPSGTLELRQAIADYTTRTRGLGACEAVDPDEVVVGPGCKPGIFMSILAVVGAGDEVIIPDPGFPSYANAITVAGGVTVRVPLTSEGDAFELDALRSAVTPKTKMIVVNSPGNPTGGMMSMEHLREIGKVALDCGCWVMSDEIYSRLVYEGVEPGMASPSLLSIPELRPKLIMADGFSKTWCMTGWRLGWAVMPKALAERVSLLVVHCFGCTASFTQTAGLTALGPALDEHIEGMVAEYRTRRDFVCQTLNAMPGVRCPVPKGAFYAFFDVTSFGLPSAEIASRILDDGGCAVLPGADFGTAAEGYLRISYVSSVPVLKEGLQRIGTVLAGLNK